MHPNTIYFLKSVGKVILIAAAIVLAIACVVGLLSLFGSHNAYTEVNVSYSVGALGSDGMADGVPVASDRTSLVSDYIPCTAFYVSRNSNIRANYEIWFYDSDYNFIEMRSYDSGSGEVPSFIEGNMPVRKNEDGKYYVDKDGNVMAAEYIRIVIKPMDGVKFNEWFPYFQIWSYSRVLTVSTTQGAQKNAVQNSLTADNTVVYDPNASEATEPAA